jgi:hypothetical protein
VVCSESVTQQAKQGVMDNYLANRIDAMLPMERLLLYLLVRLHDLLGIHVGLIKTRCRLTCNELELTSKSPQVGGLSLLKMLMVV